VQLPIGGQTFGRSFLEGKGALEIATADDAWGALFAAERPFAPETTDVASLSFGSATEPRDLQLGRSDGLKFTVAGNGSAAGRIRIIRSPDDPQLPLPELREMLRPGGLFAALELDGSAEGSVEGSYVAGPLTPTFGLAAGGHVGLTRLNHYPADTPAREVLGDLLGGVRLPQAIEAPSDVPRPGELLGFHYGGYLDLKAGLRWGYSLSGLRAFDLGKLDLALAYEVELAARLDLRYRLAGELVVEALRGQADGWVRLVVHKSNSRRFDFAQDIGLVAKAELKGLPADPNAFLGALLGTDVESWVGLLDEAARVGNLTQLRAKVDSLAWRFLQDRANEWLGKALDEPAASEFFSAARQLVAAYRGLDPGVLQLVQDFSERVPDLEDALTRIAGMADRRAFAALDDGAWAVVTALAGGHPHAVLVDDGAFARLRTSVQGTLELVKSEAGAKLLHLLRTIEGEYHLDRVFDGLARLQSPQAVHELVDARLQGVVERLLGKAWGAILSTGVGRALEEIHRLLAKLQSFKQAWYGRLQESVAQSFSASLAFEFTRASAEDRLLDIEVNLNRPEGAGLLRQATRGSFAEVLDVYDPQLVLVREGVLTHRLERAATLKVNVYGWERSNLTRVVQEYEHAIESDPSGLVHVFALRTWIEQKKEKGRRFKESVDSTFLLAGLGEVLQPAGGTVPRDTKTGAFLVKTLEKLSVQYDLVLRDESTSVAELTDYLAFGEALGVLKSASLLADELSRQFPSGLGKVQASYAVRFDEAGVRAAFSLSGQALARVARQATRRLMAAQLIGRGPGSALARVGFAYLDPAFAELYDRGFTALLQEAKGVLLPAWFLGGPSRVEALDASHRKMLLTLFAIERELDERLVELDRLVDRCIDEREPVPGEELQKAAVRFVEMAKDLDDWGGQNAFFGVFDALVHAGGGGQGRREAALVLEITPPVGEKVTKILMG
jgi:hypothetical protein